MKKKIWIPVLIVLACVILVLFILSRFFTLSVGTYMGENAVVFDHLQETPIIMLNQTGNSNAFSDLHSGDRILVLHGNSLMLSDPAQMNVFVCIRLKKGAS